jgi:hypothetical protein
VVALKLDGWRGDLSNKANHETHIFPAQAASGWQRLLAQPSLRWKRGRSAMTAAACWEAKVDEAFGPTLLEKRHRAWVGQSIRVDYLNDVLQLPQPLEGTVCYQLLHRAASAIVIAKQFHARAAVMFRSA